MTTEPKYTDAQIEPGSIWIYKGDPARRYEVISMANVASRNDAHPPQVVYRTVRKPENVWVRTVDDFHRVMTLYERQAAMQGQCGEAIIGLLRVLCPEGEKFHSDNPNNPTVLDIRKLADKLEALQSPQPVRSVSDEDAKDAARYRWLRKHDNADLLAEDVIDEAIA